MVEISELLRRRKRVHFTNQSEQSQQRQRQLEQNEPDTRPVSAFRPTLTLPADYLLRQERFRQIGGHEAPISLFRPSPTLESIPISLSHRTEENNVADETVLLSRSRRRLLEESDDSRQIRLLQQQRLDQIRRAEESEEQREARQARDRAYQRERAEALRREREARVLSNEEMREIAETGLRTLSNDRKKEIMKSVWNEIANIQKEEVCCVCDELVLAHQLNVYAFEGALREAMERKLVADADLPAGVVEYYNGGGEFTGLLLSKKGLVGESQVKMCKSCYRNLTENDTDSPPKYSVANGFAIGGYPDSIAISSYTLPELMMCSRVQTVGVINVMRGGSNRALRSHFLFFGAATPPATMLPTSLTADRYQVCLRGLTAGQRSRAGRTFEINAARVRTLLEWRQRNNHLYTDITIGESPLAATPPLQESNVNYGPEEDLPIVTHHDGQLQTAGSAISENDEETTATFIVERSTVPLNMSADPFFLENLFPELFPYGIGGLKHGKKSAISPEKTIRHLMRLSDRRFSGSKFVLVTFDVLARRRASLSALIQCRMQPDIPEAIASLSRADVEASLSLQAARTEAVRNGLEPETDQVDV